MRTFKIQVPEEVKCPECNKQTELNDRFDVFILGDGRKIVVKGYLECMTCGAEIPFGGTFAQEPEEEDD